MQNKKAPNPPSKPSKLSQPIAIQSNALIHARYEMTALQKKVLLLLISKIQPEDDSFQPYRIHAREFLESTELKSTQIYQKLKQATKGLLGKILEIKKPNGVLQITLLSSAEYYHGRGIMELSFDPKLRPHLLQLKEHFTLLPLRQVLNLRSIYAIRIYEMLQQFHNTGFFIIKVDDLKYQLSIEQKYRSYNLFKRNVILQAQKELAKTDMAFTFKEIKKGRKIDRLQFTLLPLQKITLTPDKKQLKEKLIIDLQLTDAQAKKIALKVPPKQIYQTIYDIKAAHRNGQIRTNIAAYTVATFNTKYQL